MLMVAGALAVLALSLIGHLEVTTRRRRPRGPARVLVFRRPTPEAIGQA
jgi:hypothetical protein